MTQVSFLLKVLKFLNYSSLDLQAIPLRLGLKFRWTDFEYTISSIKNFDNNLS